MNINAIEVKNLTKKFGDFVSVDNVSFNVKEGEIFGFLGANGAGKSTTLRMLCGILSPTSGDALVGGFSISNDPALVKKNIGYMSQRFSLYNDLTVEENINFFGGIYGLSGNKFLDRKRWVLDAANLLGREKTITSSLPGGIKQRLALGTAVIHRPGIVFLDEPTSGVDPISRRNFWNLINQLSEEGITIFVTTHYLEEAEEMCGRIAIMNYGELVALEPTRDLVRRLSRRTLRLWLTRALAAVPAGLDAYHPRINGDGRQLVLCLPTEQGVGDLLHRLSELHLGIDDFETDQSHLEDVFLQLTREDRKG